MCAFSFYYWFFQVPDRIPLRARDDSGKSGAMIVICPAPLRVYARHQRHNGNMTDKTGSDFPEKG